MSTSIPPLTIPAGSRDDTSPPIPRSPRSAYFHVPFCRHRCGYCDFTLVAGRDDLVERYLSALSRDLASLEQPRPVETLFFGGGTPSHLPAKQLDRLLTLARRWFPLLPGAEFCLEANPLDLLDADKRSVLAGHGVNRISLGVQSFDDEVLRLLERDHRSEDIVTVVERLRPITSNLALDLIFGVPGQSLATWRNTLQRAIALGPAHLSTYGLTFEKGTSFWSRRTRGELAAAPEDLEYEMYAAALDDLSQAGFEQYEISNFALPGQECRHNETYWAGRSYFGFGPGAARYLAGVREINHRSVTTWLSKIESGQSPIGYREQLSPENRARETLIVGLRRTRGVERAEFLAATGFELDPLGAGAWERLIARKLVEPTAGGYRLTRAGLFVADSITLELVGDE